MISKATFLQSVLPFTLKMEGGFVNDPNDPGGKTYRGITYKNYPKWSGWKVINSMNLSRNQIVTSLEPAVCDFYFSLFTGYGFHNFNNVKVALAAFDYKVNGGFTFQLLANILKTYFSKSTTQNASQIMAVANTVNADTLASKIIDARENYYNKIIANNTSLERFRSGWANRILALRVYTNLAKIAAGSTVAIILGVGIAYLLTKQMA